MHLLTLSCIVFTLFALSSPVVRASPHSIERDSHEGVENTSQPLLEELWVHTLSFLEPQDLCTLAKTDKLRKELVHHEFVTKKVNLKVFQFNKKWIKEHFGSRKAFSHVRWMKIEPTFYPGLTGHDALWMSGLPLTLSELWLNASLGRKDELSEFVNFARDLNHKTHMKVLHLNLVNRGNCPDINEDKELALELGRTLGTMTQLKSLSAPSIYLRINPEGQRWIISALENKEKLENLTLSGNRLSGIEVEEWSNIFRNLPQLSCLSLSNNCLRPEAIEPMMKEAGGRLTRLDLGSNCHGPIAVDILAKHMPLCSDLKELRLSDNWFGIEGMERVCAALTTLPSLEVISLANNCQDVDTAEKRRRLGQSLRQVIHSLPQLKNLDLSKNHLGPQGGTCVLMALQAKPHLTSLCLDGNRFGSDLSESLCRVLDQAPELQTLGLSDLSFQSKAMVSLLRSIQALSELKSLGLARSNLGSIEGESSRENFQHLKALTRLDLSNNQLTAVAYSHFYASLSHLTQLIDLDLGFNDMSGGVETVRALSCFVRLKSLVVANNHLGPLEGEALSIALKEMPELRKLDISNNKIEGEAARQIAESLRTNKNLKVICFYNNSFTENEWTELSEIFEDLVSMH